LRLQLLFTTLAEGHVYASVTPVTATLAWSGEREKGAR
jgi:hypothetical protein